MVQVPPHLLVLEETNHGRGNDRRAARRGRHPVDYRLVDATDPTRLAALGDAGSFDAAVCVMGLTDMPTIGPGG